MSDFISIFCFLVSAYLALYGKKEWGWFLFAAIILT
jgi:hypothetical protein